jgi:hypothetical protein
MDTLQSSLQEIMSENFGLAKSLNIDSKDNRVQVTLHGSATTCTCEQDAKGSIGRKGRIGCTLSSFFAVLIAAAEGRPVSLGDCFHDPLSGAWTIAMVIENPPGGSTRE